ncbi:MAG TPA: hypothetical protein VF989_16090 [Polyangiaceae bacterium]
MKDPALEALWKNTLDRWEDDRAHSAFLEHCQRTRQLDEAAMRYRGMSGDHARSEVAKKRLQGIALLALAELEALRGERPQHPSRALSYVLIAFFSAATLLVLAYVARWL